MSFFWEIKYWNLKYLKVENLKISIISAIHNRDKFILRFLKSIQSQFIDNIEIIFIDDYSPDISVEVIKESQKYDKRIILIINNVNKGTLIRRNEAVLKSRGEYLIFSDPNDLLSIDSLKYCYTKAKEEQYDIIRFNLFTGDKKHIIKLIK